MSGADVDPILLELVVRVLQCEVDAEKTKSVRDITANVLYEACVKGLRTINPNVVLNSTMPRNNASKVTMCSQVVKALQDAGYRGEVAYSALMYPNEADTRSILLWLNQNVRTDNAAETEGKRAAQGLQASIAVEFKRLLKEAWVPPCLSTSLATQLREARPVTTVPIRSAHIDGPISSRHAKQIDYIKNFMPYAVDQPPQRRQVAPSLLQAHAVSITRQREALVAQQQGENPVQKRGRIAASMATKLRAGMSADVALDFLLQPVPSAAERLQQTGLASRFTRLRNQMDRTDVTSVAATTASSGLSLEEQARLAREQQITALEEELARVNADIAATKALLESLVLGKRQLDSDAQLIAQKAAELERERAEIEMVRRLMQDPEGNKQKLQAITQANAAKLYEAAQAWEPRRLQLLEAYRAERDKFEARKEAANGLLQDIEVMRTKAKEIQADVQQKDARYRQLLEEWKQLEKGTLRSQHTDKILEGLNNVKKQNADIDKVLLDTRDLKKEIATMTDTLSRSFALVDDMIFRDAKNENDASAKTAYKLVIAMNEKFNQLIDSLSSTIQTKNASLELERQIASVKLRTNALDLDRVRTDLEQLRKENLETALRVAQLPQASGDVLG